MSIHNLELRPKQGAKYARSSGAYCKILNKVKNYIKIKLPSGIFIFLLQTCFATLGIIEDFNHIYYLYIINAGFNRLIGWRPKVRGVAMNAVDHPHGGGKGKKAGKSIVMSPWKKFPKFKKTKLKNKIFFSI